MFLEVDIRCFFYYDTGNMIHFNFIVIKHVGKVCVCVFVHAQTSTQTFVCMYVFTQQTMYDGIGHNLSHWGRDKMVASL